MPKVGEMALRRYFDEIEQAREQGGPALKMALYDLALSAIREADRIPGIEDLPGLPQATRASKSSAAASMSSS
jgi:hypothetical protein